jgi:hypothetical protein
MTSLEKVTMVIILENTGNFDAPFVSLDWKGIILYFIFSDHQKNKLISAMVSDFYQRLNLRLGAGWQVIDEMIARLRFQITRNIH